MKKLILSVFVICTITVCFLSITKVSAQSCSQIPEVAVTNVEQLRRFVTFTERFPIFEGNKLTGFTMMAKERKGHKGSGGCCSFNSGGCSDRIAIRVDVDRDNNIRSSNVKMFLGENQDGKILRVEEF